MPSPRTRAVGVRSHVPLRKDPANAPKSRWRRRRVQQPGLCYARGVVVVAVTPANAPNPVRVRSSVKSTCPSRRNARSPDRPTQLVRGCCRSYRPINLQMSVRDPLQGD